MPTIQEVNFLCCFLAFLNKPKLKSSPLICYCSIKHTVRQRILLANHTILPSSKGKRVPPLSIDVLFILSNSNKKASNFKKPLLMPLKKIHFLFYPLFFYFIFLLILHFSSLHSTSKLSQHREDAMFIQLLEIRTT